MIRRGRNRAHRAISVTMSVVVLALVVFVTWAATSRSLDTGAAPPSTSPQVTAVVAEATVSRSLSLGAEVRYSIRGAIYAPVDGVVTRLATDRTVQSGDVALWIDETPVVLADGDVPMYRELRQGDGGADVTQLQRLLATRGLLDGTDPAAIDGKFGSATRGAVREWEQAIERPVAPDGVVSLAELVFSPNLPASIRYPSDIQVGRRVAAGDLLIEFVATTPEFVIKSDPGLTELRGGMTAHLDIGGDSLRATLVGSVQLDDAAIVETGTLLEEACPSRCAELDAGTIIPVRVDVVPEITGPAVPIGALQASAEGGTQVRLADGTVREVEVRVADRGVAIVDGVRVGESVRVDSAPSEAPGA